jgi:Raf kinase inhibitor-like YbhB/YbcL family protein
MLENLPDIVGHALRGQRAGLEKTLFQRLDLRAGMAAIELKSLAFLDHAPIPERYTADGVGTSPPLQWSGVCAGARSLVLVVEDADAPTPQPLVHAIVIGLTAEDAALAEGALQSEAHPGAGYRTGLTSYLQTGWLPPDPPPGHGVHRYAFQIFALDAVPEFSEAPGRDEVAEALQAHAVASGCLIGTYERPDGSIRIDDTVAAPVMTPPAAAA